MEPDLSTYNRILEKLRRFIRRYYTQRLIQGLLLFLTLGILFFLIITGLEYFLWLGSGGRLLLFWVFLAIEVFLLYRFVLLPLLYLFRLRAGITNKDASRYIGKYFPEVDDKLYNLLDLADDVEHSELLIASLEQRSKALSPVPFVKAVDLRRSLGYVRYLGIPLGILLIIWASGRLSSFFGSYNRVIHYGTAYEAPAPFSFRLLSGDLEVFEDRGITVLVGTEGETRPQQVHIVVEDRPILMRGTKGVFEYSFESPLGDTEFYFQANGVRSKTYQIRVLKVPGLRDFEMVLQFPKYTGKGREVVKSTGNVVVPEGTRITWNISAKNTGRIEMGFGDEKVTMNKDGGDFTLTKKVYGELPYTLATSNGHVSDYEVLKYKIKVIKDDYPAIRVKQIRDSLEPNLSYYSGEVSDDYGLTELSLIYYPESQKDKSDTIGLMQPSENFRQFYYTFPSGVQVVAGLEYKLFFQIADNDGIHGGKTSRSQVFSTRILDGQELGQRALDNAKRSLKDLDGSLQKFKENGQELNAIRQEQKENRASGFAEQRKLRDFLRNRSEQERRMEEFAKELKDNLKKEDAPDDLLLERLERQEIAAEKNRKLIEELERIADKINKEELSKRLEELGKQQQSNERNLEQLLELTKRYYVTEKLNQLARDLEKLAENQKKLGEDETEEQGEISSQEKLNRDFENWVKEMDELEKENGDLAKPIKLNNDVSAQDEIKEEQEEALKELNQENRDEDGAEPDEGQKVSNRKQKSAARKMMELSQGMRASGNGGSSIVEDAEMLRQILDNLIMFSFKQEALHDKLEASDAENQTISNMLKRQKELRNLFEHIDDSIFALSLRRAELSEFVNEQISEVYYNTDKALERIAEGQTFQAISYEKYILNASNGLADFLAKILENMQEAMMSGSGQGSSGNFQLPDIIKGQQSLQQKMQGMGQQGLGSPQDGQGETGDQSSAGKKGKGQKVEGQNGEKGQQAGENGQATKGEGNKGEGGGQSGQRNTVAGQGLGESELKEIYEIYKEQQQIREQLEKQLENLINTKDRRLGEKLVKQMEDFENDLLENGITQRTMNRANNIQYELLKLENAALKQGQKERRESSTGERSFQNPILGRPGVIKDAEGEVEILNRETLPLEHSYKNRVKNYFKSGD
ncbi:MAG: DUF4175 family protein [Bacteroidota bacterium]